MNPVYPRIYCYQYYCRAIGAGILFLFTILFPGQSFANEVIPNNDCLTCHDDARVKEYNSSVHGSNLCVSCHTDIRALPHPEKTAKVNCSVCHQSQAQAYLGSIHWKAVKSGNRDAPLCVDCHGEHAIRSPKDPKSSVYPTQIAVKTCGQCHAAQRIVSKYRLPGDRLQTYFQSYHGLASKFGVTTVANCASCHSAHNILPSSDPHSTVYKNNLPRTCGKCHQNVGNKLIKVSIHSSSLKQDKIIYYVTRFYIFLIIITIGGMLAHNLLYFIPVVRAYYRRHKEKAKYVRFSKIERLQHFALLSSFILLAYTGFALRYQEAWWTAPFRIWNPGFDWRGIIHRGAAIVFTILMFFHVYYLFCTRRGKGQFKALLPRKDDLTYFIKITKYNLGLQKEKPQHARYSYVEKSEYWALVWGSVVMLVTGSLLTFEDFFLRHFSKWGLDLARTIHYYEAVLAVLAILVWHMYFVIFDPEHYPLNFSMITGKVIKESHKKGAQDVD
ncbi:MAG: cytochrome b/b6 domain-containing protein [Candidatus Omnitrophota bacterium]|nr:cytochrome b/b6 domain-containing protein [Candidatus Omnitrophota bacterium]